MRRSGTTETALFTDLVTASVRRSLFPRDPADARFTAQERRTGNIEDTSARLGWNQPAVMAQYSVAVDRPSAARTLGSSVKSPINTRIGSGSSLIRVGTASTPLETTTSGCW